MGYFAEKAFAKNDILMNTTAHLLIGVASFGNPNQRRVTVAAIAGALIPDLSLYALVGFSIVVMGIEPSVVFKELYYSDTWQTVFSIDNSFILWGGVLTLGIVRRIPWLIALGGAALLHIGADFMLHNEDARAHFWPLSQWKFFSPISYWDSQFHANWVAPIEGLLCVAITVYLFRQYAHYGVRTLFAVGLIIELYVLRQWIMFF